MRKLIFGDSSQDGTLPRPPERVVQSLSLRALTLFSRKPVFLYLSRREGQSQIMRGSEDCDLPGADRGGRV